MPRACAVREITLSAATLTSILSQTHSFTLIFNLLPGGEEREKLERPTRRSLLPVRHWTNSPWRAPSSYAQRSTLNEEGRKRRTPNAERTGNVEKLKA
jgi:hypothetical protein